MREVARSGLPAAPADRPAVTEADIAPLPAAAQRYLRFMGVVGRPRDWSFRLHTRARFRPRLDRGWIPAEIWQYSSNLEVARIFHMRMRMYGVPVRGRDLYLRGAGSLVIRPLDLFQVAEFRGPEFDTGELVTWLNDAVLLAPSFLLSPATSWTAVDDGSFDVTLRDHGHTVSARVFLDERGAVRDFSTTDRFFLDTSGRKPSLLRTRWSTPVSGWQQLSGRWLPTGGQAIWHFFPPKGDVAYADIHFQPGDLVFDVAPGT